MTNDIIQSAAFLKRYLPSVKKEGYGRKVRQNFLCWLSWHVSRLHVCSIKNANDKIVAVGIARCIKHTSDIYERYVSDEAGDILYIEKVASITNEGFKDLLRFVKARWPQCKKLIFSRQKSGNIMKMYKMDSFLRKVGI